MSTACCKLLSRVIGGYRGGAFPLVFPKCFTILLWKSYKRYFTLHHEYTHNAVCCMSRKVKFSFGGGGGGWRLCPLFLNFLHPPLRVQIILQRIIPCYGTVWCTRLRFCVIPGQYIANHLAFAFCIWCTSAFFWQSTWYWHFTWPLHWLDCSCSCRLMLVILEYDQMCHHKWKHMN